MILSGFHHELLQRIKTGEKSFSLSGGGGKGGGGKGGSDGNQLQAFQTEAEALIELEQFGLIILKAIHHETESARRWYDLIIVESLTPEGRKVQKSKF